MSLEVELLHRIESLESRVKSCEEHRDDGEYHEHLLDEDHVKEIVEKHLEKAADEIEAAIKAEEEKSSESKEEESPESEPAGKESSSSDEKQEEPKKDETKSEVEPNRRHFLHRKVGGKHAA